MVGLDRFFAGDAEVGGDERLRRGGDEIFVSSSSSPASIRSSSSRDIVRGKLGINEELIDEKGENFGEILRRRREIEEKKIGERKKEKGESGEKEGNGADRDYMGPDRIWQHGGWWTTARDALRDVNLGHRALLTQLLYYAVGAGCPGMPNYQ